MTKEEQVIVLLLENQKAMKDTVTRLTDLVGSLAQEVLKIQNDLNKVIRHL